MTRLTLKQIAARSGQVMVVAAGKGGKTYGYNVDLGEGRYTTIQQGSDYREAQRRRKEAIRDEWEHQDDTV